MDRKVILSRYIKAIYRDINKVIMSLVSIKNLGKSRRISDKELFRKTSEFKGVIMHFLASAMNNVEEFYKWADSGQAMFGIGQKENNGIFTFRKRTGDNPSGSVTINRESITTVEKHFTGGALIKYFKDEPKEVITWEKFNEVISQLGFEVEYKNGRYITKEKSSKSIKVSELKEKLDEILSISGDIELEATFSVVRSDGDYKIRNTGTIDKIIEFCKQKIEKPKEEKSKFKLNDGPFAESIYMDNPVFDAIQRDIVVERNPGLGIDPVPEIDNIADNEVDQTLVEIQANRR